MYEELEVYSGDKTQCDNCQREFGAGEVIVVDSVHNLSFCYSGADNAGVQWFIVFLGGK